MKKLMFVILFSLLIHLFLGSAVLAQQLSVLKAADLKLIYYSKAHSYIISHLASCFENSLGFYKTLFDYEPSEDVTIFLQDFSDYGNGGATAVPSNIIMVSVAPFMYYY